MEKSRRMNIKHKDFKFQVNDILYTKDGRATGNLTVVKVYEDNGVTKIVCYSDYGNQVIHDAHQIINGIYFFEVIGHATLNHKYRDYVNENPEIFV